MDKPILIVGFPGADRIRLEAFSDLLHEKVGDVYDVLVVALPLEVPMHVTVVPVPK